jgi:glutaminyl-tRNA synthetase
LRKENITLISGLRRRGYTPASIRDFVERIGISKVDSMTDMKICKSSNF